MPMIMKMVKYGNDEDENDNDTTMTAMSVSVGSSRITVMVWPLQVQPNLEETFTLQLEKIFFCRCLL